VHDPHRVKRAEPRGNLCGDPGRHIDGQAALLGDEIGERPALTELRRDEQEPVTLTELDQGDEVRMNDGRRHLRLAAEAGDVPHVSGQPTLQNLEGDPLLASLANREVDGPRGPLAKPRLDHVRPDAGAGRELIGRASRAHARRIAECWAPGSLR
jgi:hypothetical protein